MKNGLMLLGDGFEETEAITTHDILTRTHNITLKYVSISPSLEVASSMGIVVKAEGFIAEETPKAYDFSCCPVAKRASTI
jgi:putative intracellular protease/amidase